MMKQLFDGKYFRATLVDETLEVDFKHPGITQMRSDVEDMVDELMRIRVLDQEREPYVKRT